MAGNNNNLERNYVFILRQIILLICSNNNNLKWNIADEVMFVWKPIPGWMFSNQVKNTYLQFIITINWLRIIFSSGHILYETVFTIDSFNSNILQKNPIFRIPLLNKLGPYIMLFDSTVWKVGHVWIMYFIFLSCCDVIYSICLHLRIHFL